MSVIVYQDGEPLKIDPSHLEHYLSLGWSLSNHQYGSEIEPDPAPSGATDPEPSKDPEPVNAEEVISEPEAPQAPEDTQQYTNQEIRNLAQLSGIVNWETAKIKTLKKALGLGDEQA